jgi:hypothetical protein
MPSRSFSSRFKRSESLACTAARAVSPAAHHVTLRFHSVHDNTQRSPSFAQIAWHLSRSSTACSTSPSRPAAWPRWVNTSNAGAVHVVRLS